MHIEVYTRTVNLSFPFVSVEHSEKAIKPVHIRDLGQYFPNTMYIQFIESYRKFYESLPHNVNMNITYFFVKIQFVCMSVCVCVCVCVLCL